MKIEVGNHAWRVLSFSRRMETAGYEPEDIPTLPQECAKQLWDAINSSVHQARAGEGKTAELHSTPAGEFWKKFAEKCYDAGVAPKYMGGFNPASFLSGDLHYTLHHERFKAIDAVEYLFRTPGMPEDLARKIENALQGSEYHIDYSVSPISVVWSAPYISTEAGQRTIGAVHDAGLTEAAKHLQESEKKISTGDYRGAMEECGIALESIVQVIDPRTKNKPLNECLKFPKVEEFIKHPALNFALGKLYAYLGDEVRHAKGNEKPKIDKELAVFFYGLSTTFAEYLVHRYRKSEKT